MKRRRNKEQLEGCDSMFELELRKGVLSRQKYHPSKITYTAPATTHTYQPDWVIPDIRANKTRWLYIEAKGRFRDRAEYTKYIHIRESLDDQHELVFLFQNPLTPMPGAKRRKDGSKRTHMEWAGANNFSWFTKETIGFIL